MIASNRWFRPLVFAALGLFTLAFCAYCLTRAYPTGDRSLYQGTTPAITNRTVTLLALGDQGTGDWRQRRVAALLETACRWPTDLNSILLLGDNFYFDGVDSTEDTLWSTDFEQAYDYPCLTNQSFYAILGNHDHRSNYAAQIDYSTGKMGTGRWHMPARAYVRSIGQVGGKSLVRIAVIDTSWEATEQMKLLRKAFSNPDDSVWRIVAGHMNIRTGSEKYASDQRTMQKFLPLLKELDVHLYLSGHSHNQQLIVMEREPVYVISGAGGKATRPLQQGTEGRKFSRQSLGFVELKFDIDHLNINFHSIPDVFIDQSEVEIDRFAMVLGNPSGLERLTAYPPNRNAE